MTGSYRLVKLLYPIVTPIEYKRWRGERERDIKRGRVREKEVGRE